MTDQQLRSFLCAAKCGSFSSAARELYITPTALIYQIKQLESSIGFELFNRSAHGIELTEAGVGFQETAETILLAMDSGIEKGRMLSQKEHPCIRMSTDAVELQFLVVDLIQKFNPLHPEVEFSFVPAPYDSQLEDLIQNRVDVLWFSEQDCFHTETEFCFTPLRVERMYCVLSPQHPLADHTQLRIEDLDHERLFLSKSLDRGGPNSILERIQASGLTVHCDTTPFRAPVIYKLLTEGGILVVPEQFLPVYTSIFTVLPLEGFQRTYGFVSRPDPGEALRSFIDFAADRFKKQGDSFCT